MGGAGPPQPEKITRAARSKAKIANFNDLWIYIRRDLLKLNIFTFDGEYSLYY
jgi:hypothetical protein